MGTVARVIRSTTHPDETMTKVVNFAFCYPPSQAQETPKVSAQLRGQGCLHVDGPRALAGQCWSQKEAWASLHGHSSVTPSCGNLQFARSCADGYSNLWLPFLNLIPMKPRKPDSLRAGACKRGGFSPLASAQAARHRQAG